MAKGILYELSNPTPVKRWNRRSNNIMRGNIYSSNLTCSDKALNIRAKTKV